MRPECAEQVAKALGVPKLSSQYKNKITELYSRAQNILARNDPDWIKKSDAEKAEAIANKTAADIAQQIAKNNENIARDAIIKAKLEQEIFNHPKLNPIEVLTRKLAYFSDQSGVQSVEIHAKQLHAYWISRASDVFTETQKGFGFLTNKEKTDDIVKALFGTKSADPEVNRIADSLASVFDDVRTTFNRNGGNVKKLDDWGMPTSHDQQKVALVGSKKWVDSIIDKVNRNKYVNEDGTLMTDIELRELLSEAYKTISTGGANKSLSGDTSPSPIGGRAKMANRHQESRVIHFKDGQSWLEYQKDFGTYHQSGLHQVVDNHVKRMSGEIAMMQAFGTNPKYVFDELLKKGVDLELVKETNALNHGKIAAQKKRAESIYEYMDASVQPIDNSFGNIMGGLRALMTASKLGSATLTTISDHANMKRISNMNGMSYSRSIMPEFTKQLASGNHQKEAISMGLGINEMIGSMMRFGDADMISSATKSGRFNASMQSVASMVMKASGLNATTAAAKRAFSLVHMHKIADMTRSKQWSELGEHDLKMLKGNGIKEEDWNLWRDLTPSKRENGEMVLTQNDFFSAPDDVIKKYLHPDHQSDRYVLNARYDFARRYMNHIFSEEGVAIIDSGARERSLTQFGQAGTFQGELGRTLFQFKAYPMGYLMRMGSRAFAQDDITSRATFLISLLAYQTIAGGMVAQLQNIANGKQPEPVFTTDFFLKSVLKGGGFSFLGDLMSAMSDPTGRGMGDFVAGPLIGSAFKLGMLFTGLGNNIIEGKESTRGMEIANAIKSNVPFQNLWYTKLVIDRMLYSKMQNMIDPDYLRRTQTRMENLGNQYWWDLNND